ncbi:MAG: hypothetical protein QOK48_2850 [Blastocatellia bacterium]|nr:hypothetical protein [Blastocatellia bacterium]
MIADIIHQTKCILENLKPLDCLLADVCSQVISASLQMTRETQQIDHGCYAILNLRVVP